MGSAIPNMQSGSQVAVNWSDSGHAALSVVYILSNTVGSLHRPWSLLTAGHFKTQSTFGILGSTFCLGWSQYSNHAIPQSCRPLCLFYRGMMWPLLWSSVSVIEPPRLFHYLQISVLPAPKQPGGGALFTQYIQETTAGKCAAAARVT